MSAVLAPKSTVSPAEWALRVQLAGAYRVADHLGWAELIYTHISARVPGPEHHFLINPYGLRFDEVTASSLVKIDSHGESVGPQEYPANKAGFIIHSAIHMAREDAQCVWHMHTLPGMAVSAQEDGLLPTHMYSHNRFQLQARARPVDDTARARRVAARLSDDPHQGEPLFARPGVNER
jgi:ribulose-5-phosphate 4-epimerase/fuculose-1-phosphate aldolase